MDSGDSNGYDFEESDARKPKKRKAKKSRKRGVSSETFSPSPKKKARKGKSSNSRKPSPAELKQEVATEASPTISAYQGQFRVSIQYRIAGKTLSSADRQHDLYRPVLLCALVSGRPSRMLARCSSMPFGFRAHRPRP